MADKHDRYDQANRVSLLYVLFFGDELLKPLLVLTVEMTLLVILR